MTKNLTTGQPAKLIVLFTIPLLIGNLFQQFYSMADTLIVGRTIGVNALAAVGCTGSITFFILGFAQGLSSGLSIITAQRFGAQDEEGIRRSAAASIVISLCVTVILTALAIPLTMPLLRMLQTPEEIIGDAYQYLVIIFTGMGACVLFNLLSNLVRALGDSRTPLYFLVIACVLNIGLDFLCILGFNMGVAGAAYATVLAQLFSGILCIIYIKKKLPLLWLTKDDFRIRRWEVAVHLKVGLPMAFQSSIIAIGSLILQFALNGLGAVSVAAYTAAQKIDMLATLPMSSFGTTMATYAAQNYGAQKYARIRKGVFQCAAISVSFAVVMGLVNIFAGYQLVEIFVGGGQKQVLSLAQVYLRVNGSMYFVLSLLFIFRFTLQGLGKGLVPTIAGIMELVMRAFAAVVLAGAFGFAGACWANPLAWLGSCIPLTIAYIITHKKMPKQDVDAMNKQAQSADTKHTAMNHKCRYGKA